MSFAAQLPPSPVSAAFLKIQWAPLDKLRLTREEENLLHSAEVNPIDYTLSDANHASAYVRVLLKVLGESSGPSGPSKSVSKLKSQLPDDEAAQMLHIDPIGVALHYSVAKLHEVLACVRERKKGATVASTFYGEKDGRLIDGWRALLRILHLGGGGDAFAQRGAALCLAQILSGGCPSQRSGADYAAVDEPLAALISWIASQLQSSVSSSLSLVTPALTALMGSTEARLLFAGSGGIGYLTRHLRARGAAPANPRGKPRRAKNAGATVQQLYELCFCLWTMTYECEASYSARAAFNRDGSVQTLVDLVSGAPREKVVRVALSALRNLATCGSTDASEPDPVGVPGGRKAVNGATFLGDMIGCGLMKQVDLMRERQWTDPDIVEDLKILHKLLHDNYKEMSRWDVYQAEIDSGHLEWGVLHTEKFFKQNAKMLEGSDGNFGILRTLIQLTASDDEDVIAIACYDIGEFVRHYPNGKAVARRLGAQTVVMQLIEHENADVQRHALQCVSKMMVNNWAAVH